MKRIILISTRIDGVVTRKGYDGGKLASEFTPTQDATAEQLSRQWLREERKA